MNNKEQAIEQIEEFLQSNEKGMLLTGTNQYEKHKLIIAVLEKNLRNNLLLFRTNSMQNISNTEHLGWAGVKQTPKAGERIEIGRNVYECDSFNTSSTWLKTNHEFSCAVVYPIDPFCRSQNLKAIDNLFQHKDITKIFLVSWTDRASYDYSVFSQLVSRHVVYDVEEENPSYHQFVLDLDKHP